MYVVCLYVYIRCIHMTYVFCRKLRQYLRSHLKAVMNAMICTELQNSLHEGCNHALEDKNEREACEIRALDESVKVNTCRICDNREIKDHLTDFEKIDL